MGKKSILNLTFFNLVLVVFFTIETNYDWGHNRFLHWGCVALLLVAYIFKDGGVLDLKFRDYSWWMLGILILSVISFIYTINLSNSISMFKTLVIVFVSFFIIRNYMTDTEKINDVLNSYIIAAAINMLYVITNIDMTLIGEVRLGTEAMEGWNANTMGIMAVVGAVLCIYMFSRNRDILSKFVYGALIAFFVYMFIYTGSRKAIIMFLLCVILMLFFSNPKAVIRNLLITVIILYAAYYICMNVESIYNVLGVRLEGLFASITGEGEVDSSTMKRQLYIENGIQWIKASPIIGYGLDGYRTMNGIATGEATYSHNNFVEIAINWGIIGFIYYYSIFVYGLKNIFSKIKGNLLAITVTSLIIVHTALHYGMVTYYEIFPNLIICVLCALANAKENKNERKSESDD